MEQNKKLHHEISIVEQTSKELEIQFYNRNFSTTTKYSPFFVFKTKQSKVVRGMSRACLNKKHGTEPPLLISSYLINILNISLQFYLQNKHCHGISRTCWQKDIKYHNLSNLLLNSLPIYLFNINTIKVLTIEIPNVAITSYVINILTNITKYHAKIQVRCCFLNHQWRLSACAVVTFCSNVKTYVTRMKYLDLLLWELIL